MAELRYFTAGESHGPCLLTFIEGVPYGAPVEAEPINTELARRQGGYGRGARMKVERDEVEVVGGVRHGRATGGPLVFRIANRVQNLEQLGPIHRARPGHADLAGALKYGTSDARNVAERASARETTARVAAGAWANHYLSLFGIRAIGFVVEIAGIRAGSIPEEPAELERRRDASSVYVPDPGVEAAIHEAIDQARSDGDTLGGVVEVRVFGVPPGLGSHTSFREKLDGRLARAVMSVQTVKAVEIGTGCEAARSRGSAFHDVIQRGPDGRLTRRTNHAGGIEGGMTNGMPVVVRAHGKPISTLRAPLETVDLATGEATRAAYERSDVCVIPAASVIVQAVVAFEMARAFLEKFGADTQEEVERRHVEYLRRVDELTGVPAQEPDRRG